MKKLLENQGTRPETRKSIASFVFHLSILALNFGTSTGCMSTQRAIEPEFEASEVLERVGELAQRPDWANGSEPIFKELGNVTFISTLTMTGNARPDACTQTAANFARGNILREVQENITLSGQINEQLSATDPAIESLMAYLAQGKLSGARVARNYWEKRVESDQTGRRVLKIYCAAAVVISEDDLRSQIYAAIDGSNKAEPAIREKLKQAHESFLESLQQR